MSVSELFYFHNCDGVDAVAFALLSLHGLESMYIGIAYALYITLAWTTWDLPHQSVPPEKLNGFDP